MNYNHNNDFNEKAHKVMVSVGIVSDGYCIVNHNLNISDMVPICQVGNNGVAVVIYITTVIDNNNFKVGVMYANNYTLSVVPDNTKLNIIWTY